MAGCDMCGSDGKLFRTKIEGTEMMLCSNCSKFGKVIAAPRIVIKKQSPKKTKKTELLEVIVPDYGRIVKERREKLNLKQEELAKKINEKESIINKIESNKFEPSIALAKKLENFLKIRLVKEQEEASTTGNLREEGPVTIGDIIKVRAKKQAE